MGSTELREAAQQALEALELAQTDVYWELNSPTRKFLRKAEKNLCAALAEPTTEDSSAVETVQERNFCPRCGKRTNDIHTCTPPHEERFCDTHCTWADHAPGCVRAEPVQEPVSVKDGGAMSALRQAAQQALEALDALWQRGVWEDFRGVANNLRAALAEPREKPWRCGCGANLYIDENGAPRSKA